LSLNDLASRLDISRNRLSFIINKYSGLCFYDFVNKFRIEEVKKIMTNSGSEEKNILEIAYDAGFNSKATFNRIFKKYTKTTTSAYRNKITSG